MLTGLIITLVIIFIAPFTIKAVERNLEFFLFAMGIIASGLAGVLSYDLMLRIFGNHFMYLITGAVLLAGIIFKLTVLKLRKNMVVVVEHIPLPFLVFLIITVLGLCASIVSAIVAALILVELVQALPVRKEDKIKICIIACFSIGLGASLTPVGEPLATIVVSTLEQDFFYLLGLLGPYIIPCILGMGLLGALAMLNAPEEIFSDRISESMQDDCTYVESYQDIFFRAGKIFVFVIALELLGAGFKPLINEYIINLDGFVLYWINMLSAVLDNATLAAAEISPLMSEKQIIMILMGLLISGGMLIPGNIPNIITASKLRISSKEWAKLGLPLGALLLVIYYVILFRL